EEFVETSMEPVLFRVESIEIKMVQSKPRQIIRFEQGKAGTFDTPGETQRTQQRAHEGRLAGAEVAGQVQDEARDDARGEALREGIGGRRVGQAQHESVGAGHLESAG